MAKALRWRQLDERRAVSADLREAYWGRSAEEAWSTYRHWQNRRRAEYTGASSVGHSRPPALPEGQRWAAGVTAVPGTRGGAPAAHQGRGASYILDISHVILQKRRTSAGTWCWSVFAPRTPA
jgi:hypothetical protein